MYSQLIPAIDQQISVRFLENGTICAVEELVMKRAKEFGWSESMHFVSLYLMTNRDGLHCEGGLFSTLLALLFWDQIFMFPKLRHYECRITYASGIWMACFLHHTNRRR